MNLDPEIAFDDAGLPVATTEFPYDELDAPCSQPNSSAEALETLVHGLLIVIRDGHADSTRTRAVALARLLGLYESDVAAAREIDVEPSTVMRAVRRLRGEIIAAAQRPKPPRS